MYTSNYQAPYYNNLRKYKQLEKLNNTIYTFKLNETYDIYSHSRYVTVLDNEIYIILVLPSGVSFNTTGENKLTLIPSTTLEDTHYVKDVKTIPTDPTCDPYHYLNILDTSGGIPLDLSGVPLICDTDQIDIDFYNNSIDNPQTYNKFLEQTSGLYIGQTEGNTLGITECKMNQNNSAEILKNESCLFSCSDGYRLNETLSDRCVTNDTTQTDCEADSDKTWVSKRPSVDDTYTGGECILQNIYTKEECNTPNTWKYGKFERVKMDKVNEGITEEFGIVRCNERSGEEQTWLGSTGTPELYSFYEKLASSSPSWETEWGQDSIVDNIRGELDGTKFCIPDDCFIPQSTSDNSDYLDKIHYNDYIQIKVIL